MQILHKHKPYIIKVFQSRWYFDDNINNIYNNIYKICVLNVSSFNIAGSGPKILISLWFQITEARFCYLKVLANITQDWRLRYMFWVSPYNVRLLVCFLVLLAELQNYETLISWLKSSFSDCYLARLIAPLLQVVSVVAARTGDQFPAAAPRPRPPEGWNGAGAGKGRAIAARVQAGHSGCAGSSWGGRRHFLQVRDFSTI